MRVLKGHHGAHGSRIAAALWESLLNRLKELWSETCSASPEAVQVGLDVNVQLSERFSMVASDL